MVQNKTLNFEILCIMKRYQIDDIITQADDIIRSSGLALPPLAYWTPDVFAANALVAKALIDAKCIGIRPIRAQRSSTSMRLFLFTLRNRRLADLQRGSGMCYAEKLLVERQDQLSPRHSHVIKAKILSTVAAQRWSLSYMGRTKKEILLKTAVGW